MAVLKWLRDWGEWGRAFSLPVPCAFPPPYRAMLAINSDVEWTSWDVQMALLRECASRQLETAFSFWLYGSPKVTWRLFTDDGRPTCYAAAAFQLARAGLLDTNHSIGGRRHLGGCSFDRNSIARAYDKLAAEDIKVAVYSGHGSREDRQNVAGAWADYQEGDLPGSDVYHLDLTLGAGARYFWCDPDYTRQETVLAPRVDDGEALFVSGVGRDGHHYVRFRRFCGSLPASGPSLCNLEPQLAQVLDTDRQGYTVLYQHLGVERHPDGRPNAATLPPLRADAARSLDRLKTAQDDGRILVTTTARLLDHAALMTARPWRMLRAQNHLTIVFDEELKLAGARWSINWRALEGWTVPANDLASASARLGSSERRLPEFTVEGRRYFGIPWSRIDMVDAIAHAEAIHVAAGQAAH